MIKVRDSTIVVSVERLRMNRIFLSRVQLVCNTLRVHDVSVRVSVERLRMNRILLGVFQLLCDMLRITIVPWCLAWSHDG